VRKSAEADFRWPARASVAGSPGGAGARAPSGWRVRDWSSRHHRPCAFIDAPHDAGI